MFPGSVVLRHLAVWSTGLLLLACGPSDDRARVLLVGIDGATFRLIDPLIADGRLPHLASLVRGGVHGPLRSAQPIYSPRIWNTIATGKVPDKHGITNFSRTDEAGNHHLLLGSDRKVHAVWNIASDAGLSVATINWWNTYPPEKIRGVMVSDHVLASQVEGRKSLTKAGEVPESQLVYPAAWEKRTLDWLAMTEPLTTVPTPFGPETLFPKWLDWKRDVMQRQFDEDQGMTRVALGVEEELDPDVMLVFLPGIDRVSHWIWGSIEPPELYPKGLQFHGRERTDTAAALRGYYVFTDALIGKLLERYGEQDLVMVVSDHGFEAGHRMWLLTGAHDSEKALDGVFFARGPGIPQGERVEGLSIDDVTPTLLAWLRLPVGDDMDGRPAAFLGEEWSRIATHDVGEVERISAAPSGVEGTITEQLRGLGYLE